MTPDWITEALAAIPRPAPKYAKLLDQRTDAEMNAAIDVAELMLHDFPSDHGPIVVATVGRLIFGDEGFTERQLIAACQDPGVCFVAQSVVDMAGTGLRL